MERDVQGAQEANMNFIDDKRSAVFCNLIIYNIVGEK